ncbi:MAG: hypothetical protein JO132_18105 [Streptosporangiaceae bacterium]|nr:hypothetical protein [Streptosporangiaceae bacterium]
MAMPPEHAFSRLIGRARVVVMLTAALTLAGAASTAPALAAPAAAATAAPYSCAANGPTGGQTIYGTFGDAGVIGWAGNTQAVVACLGGSFFVDTSGPGGGPGSGSTAAVTGTTYGYGVYDDSPTTWANADGYLPALVTTFHRDGATISITNFGDDVTIGGDAFVIIYSRVQVTNPTGSPVTIDPEASAGLIPLNSAPDTVPPHGTVNHDYAVPSDKFGGSYPYPSDSAVVAAGGFDQHFAHMATYWNGQLASIAQIQQLPDQQLVDAYKTGFIYTQIIRAGEELKTGANGYDKEFSHDVIGILANLFTQGYFTDAHGLLDRARYVIGSQTQYADGVWTYPWVWAIYLLKTGDLGFVKANFSTEGPSGASEPSIKDAAHLIATDRTGPGGIMEKTNDVDANGYWTIDNYEALTGLWAYHWLAEQVGNTSEATWAASEYDSLLAVVNTTLDATISAYQLNYLPCSMTEPNTDNRCANAEDANWAAPFLFGRWAWDGYLFGAPLSGPGLTLIDATYRYGFARLAGKLPPDTFGGYPTQYYSTAYNAGYGEWGLASNDYRDQGILGYQFMIANGQDGPYSWWESQQFPNPGSPWIGVHPENGNGSCPHAWGIANANMVLLDSLAAQRSDGSLVVGRGVPDSWVRGGQVISVANFPTTDGKHLGLTIRASGASVTLTLSGGQAAGPVLFQLPAFVDNIAHASSGTVDEQTGTVTLPGTVRSVTVRLTHAEPSS